VIKLLNVLRLVCLLLALAVVFSDSLAPYLPWPLALTAMQRFGIILPLLAIFNVATTHIRKHTRLAEIALASTAPSTPQTPFNEKK